MKKYRYMVTWGGESVYVTAATPREALKSAAAEWRLKVKEIAGDTKIIPLYQVKGGAPA